MASPSTPGQGDKRRHDDDALADSSESPLKKQKGVENVEESREENQGKTLAVLIEAGKQSALEILKTVTRKGLGDKIYLKNTQWGPSPICKAPFCIPKELRGLDKIESLYRFRVGHKSVFKYYHISCFEQMFSLTELQPYLILDPDPWTDFPSEIKAWYARVVGKQQCSFLSEVLAELLQRRYIDYSSLKFLRYLRHSEEGDNQIEGLSEQPLQQLTLSQFTSFTKHPDNRHLFQFPDGIISEDQTVAQAIEASSQSTNKGKGVARPDFELALETEDISSECEKARVDSGAGFKDDSPNEKGEGP